MCFTTLDGHRTASMVFDLPGSSGMRAFAEPFINELSADVQLAPAMDVDDLRKGPSPLRVN